MSRALSVASLALVLAACGPALSPEAHIERPRVIAGRVSAASDPGRVTLLPGERALVDFLIARPTTDAEVPSATFTACVLRTPSSPNVVAECEGAPFASQTMDAPGDSLRVLFDVPTDATETIGLQIATCTGARAILSPSGTSARCDGPGRVDLARLSVTIATDATHANHAPRLADDAQWIDDVPWAAPPDDRAAVGCADGPLPRVSRSGGAVTMRFGTSVDARESFDAFDADGRPIVARERLALTLFTTLGESSALPRIDDDAELTSETTWTPPGDDALDEAQRASLAEGLLVRTWLVVRDLRGGTDWIERDLCLVP